MQEPCEKKSKEEIRAHLEIEAKRLGKDSFECNEHVVAILKKHAGNATLTLVDIA